MSTILHKESHKHLLMFLMDFPSLDQKWIYLMCFSSLDQKRENMHKPFRLSLSPPKTHLTDYDGMMQVSHRILA